MKYFRNTKGEVFAFEEDGTQDHLITGDMTGTTLTEITADRAATPEMLAAQAQREAKQTGELYSDTGITVPFTNEVANGLMQVQNGFNAAAALVVAGGMTQADYDALSVNLEISATVKIPLTPATILPFSAWFWTKRSAFF